MADGAPLGIVTLMIGGTVKYPMDKLKGASAETPLLSVTLTVKLNAPPPFVPLKVPA